MDKALDIIKTHCPTAGFQVRLYLDGSSSHTPKELIALALKEDGDWLNAEQKGILLKALRGKRGRASDITRTERLHVRFTPQEVAILKQQAIMQGLSFSDYIRGLVLNVL